MTTITRYIGLDDGASKLASDIIDCHDAIRIKRNNLVHENVIVDEFMLPMKDSLYINEMIVFV